MGGTEFSDGSNGFDRVFGWKHRSSKNLVNKHGLTNLLTTATFVLVPFFPPSAESSRQRCESWFPTSGQSPFPPSARSGQEQSFYSSSYPYMLALPSSHTPQQWRMLPPMPISPLAPATLRIRLATRIAAATQIVSISPVFNAWLRVARSPQVRG